MSHYENEDLIECDHCFTQYKNAISPMQAQGCACELIIKEKNKFIYCSYGSQYDTFNYKIKEDSILMKKTKVMVLCDDCMEDFIKIKQIMKQEDIFD